MRKPPKTMVDILVDGCCYFRSRRIKRRHEDICTNHIEQFNHSEINTEKFSTFTGDADCTVPNN